MCYIWINELHTRSHALCYKLKLIGTQPYALVYYQQWIFLVLWEQSSADATKTKWPPKPEIFNSLALSRVCVLTPVWHQRLLSSGNQESRNKNKTHTRLLESVVFVCLFMFPYSKTWLLCDCKKCKLACGIHGWSLCASSTFLMCHRLKHPLTWVPLLTVEALLTPAPDPISGTQEGTQIMLAIFIIITTSPHMDSPVLAWNTTFTVAWRLAFPRSVQQNF